jgi:hypothetical protein
MTPKTKKQNINITVEKPFRTKQVTELETRSEICLLLKTAMKIILY